MPFWKLKSLFNSTMETSDNSSKLINNALLSIFSFLILAGIMLIVRSEMVYKDSYELTKNVLAATQNKMNSGQLPNYSGIKDGYSQALSFFILAFGCIIVMLLLPRLQAFTISPTGGVSVTLQNLQQNVNSLMQQTNTLQATSTGVGGIKPSEKITEVATGNLENASLFAKNKNDPQKGKCGGKKTDNDRRISASVSETSAAGLFKVLLTVESTNTNNPMSGIVKFHLHPTFSNPNPIIAVRNGKAVLELGKVYGAFTVTAEMDNGKTCLELDLSELPDAPNDFKLR